jgi:hypothetical protein
MNIKKMEKLLRLTASDHEEEARTAAFMLCKMLREGKADLSRLNSSQPLVDRMQETARRQEAQRKAREQATRYAAQHRENLRKRQEEWQKEVRAQRQREREERVRNHMDGFKQAARAREARNTQRIKDDWQAWGESF